MPRNEMNADTAKRDVLRFWQSLLKDEEAGLPTRLKVSELLYRSFAASAPEEKDDLPVRVVIDYGTPC